jgi:hypothetical protein
MADAVKVTVIATGFERERPSRFEEPPAVLAAAPQAPSIWLSEETPVPEPVPAAAVPEPEPAVFGTPGNGTPFPPLPEEEDLDDLDTPAYLRQRRMLH